MSDAELRAIVNPERRRLSLEAAQELQERQVQIEVDKRVLRAMMRHDRRHT